MTEDVKNQEYATLFLGCPEVPVQMGISLYLSHMLRKSGRQVTIAANPSVIKLARVADPERHYMDKIIDLDRCIGDIAEKKRSTDIAILFQPYLDIVRPGTGSSVGRQARTTGFIVKIANRCTHRFG